MRNLIVFLHSSVDGMVEGPNGTMDIGFVAYNEELEAVANQVLSTVDTILWGRKTYEMMYGYWPTMLDNPDASDHERNHAAWIEKVEKLVCSTSLEKAGWNNTTLLKGDIVGQLKQLKMQEGGDILVLDSSRLAKFLMEEGLVGVLKLSISPVSVGGDSVSWRELQQNFSFKRARF
ncbi:dihydrofolate reductase family protein [Streptococcus sp. A27]|uniref:dihydrofolate reductase family protein n=1 Tax=unclassified Streptococcus TaxID=2608887 RepID=UPI001EE15227